MKRPEVAGYCERNQNEEHEGDALLALPLHRLAVLLQSKDDWRTPYAPGLGSVISRKALPQPVQPSAVPPLSRTPLQPRVTSQAEASCAHKEAL